MLVDCLQYVNKKESATVDLIVAKLLQNNLKTKNFSSYILIKDIST
jgi:hypothetical protein